MVVVNCGGYMVMVKNGGEGYTLLLAMSVVLREKKDKSGDIGRIERT